MRTTSGSHSAPERAIAHVAALSAGAPVDPALRITLTFHPDRPAGPAAAFGRGATVTAPEPDSAGRTPSVLESMARDGVYRSQFETGTGNGGLTAHPGGDRWRWESRLFGGAYDDAPPSQRPVYGVLDHRRSGTGGASRFGSAHLRLAGHVLARSTFCYPDSVFEPTNLGVAGKMSLIALATAAGGPDPLDDYVEAHVHGRVVLATDVEALVLDPCFRGTGVERAAGGLGCPVEWHGGFRLGVHDLARHADYRGPEAVQLGMSLARQGYLDPAVLGEAAHSGRWAAQDLKRVWHLLARFGAPPPAGVREAAR